MLKVNDAHVLNEELLGLEQLLGTSQLDSL